MAGKKVMGADTPDEDSPEWTDEDFARARPLFEVAPGLMRKTRGPQKAPRKEHITIRLSHEVVSRFRASGAGWQTKMDDVLKSWLKRNSP